MPPSAAVVGRERELAVIESFLVAEPCPRALVVEGEPGAGKTTLLRAAIARAPDARVLACWPAQGESALSFVGLGDLLRPHLDDVLPVLPRPQRRALAGALYLDEATDDVAGAHVVGAATLNALGLLAARRPALLVVDDGQWLDAASAEVLAWVVRRLPERLPVRVVLARRTSPEPLPLDLERALDDALLTRLAPEPLDADAVYALVRERLGVVLGLVELRRVHELSGGNPFFALELARAGADGGLPASLGGLVDGRLGRLPEDTRHALAVCAYLARPKLDVVSAATDGDGRALLGPAMDGGVVEVADGVVRFAHPLLAEGARAAVAPSAVRALHARLAETAATAEERAGHRAKCTDAPDEPTAQELENAARAALRRGATQMAASLAEDAMRFSATNQDAFTERALFASDALYTAGRMGDQRALIERALATVPRGRNRALLLTSASTDLRVEVGLAVGREALENAEGDPTAMTHALITIASSHFHAADVSRTWEALSEALRHAPFADDRTAARAYAGAASIAMLIGDPTATDLLERARALERRSGRLVGDDSPDLMLGMFQGFADRLDDARATLTAYLLQADEEADEVARLSAHFHLAEVEWRAGRWNAASDHAARAIRLSLQDGSGSAWTGWLDSLIAASVGELDRALAGVSAGLPVVDEAGEGLWGVMYRWVGGFCELAGGRADAALRYLDQVAPLWDEMGAFEQGASHHASDELEALILVGREADAERRIDEEAARAEALDRDRLRGVVDRARGMLDSRRGQHSEAVDALLRAEALHGAGPLPFDHGRTLLALGEAQRRAGRRRDARTSLQSAGAIFERLGARPWSARTDAELGRLGGRVASGDELTATEQRVAALVAEGRTNREVAAELVVSVRAVEANLTRVYAKLGIRSRAELAARFRG